MVDVSDRRRDRLQRTCKWWETKLGGEGGVVGVALRREKRGRAGDWDAKQTRTRRFSKRRQKKEYKRNQMQRWRCIKEVARSKACTETKGKKKMRRRRRGAGSGRSGSGGGQWWPETVSG